jgi:hypothetical protein
MKKILLLSLTSLLSFNVIADYKIYGSQKNSLPIPKERPLFEQKVSFENGETHENFQTSGYFSTKSQINISSTEIHPTDGNLLGSPYSPGGQFKAFYSYIDFTVPEYVENFKINFNYIGPRGSVNGSPKSEIKLQKAKYHDSNFTTIDTMTQLSYSNWRTFNSEDIINDNNSYRIEIRVGVDSWRTGSPVFTKN